MKNNSTKQHWEEIYKEKNTTSEVSWYQDNPQTSVNLILSTNVSKNSTIIDIGGGDSKLADKLLECGFKNVFVLDISIESLKRAQTRLGKKATKIIWVESDVLDFATDKHFTIWHDRATFHFLTKEKDIARYVDIVGKLIEVDGYLIISTFSKDGPKKCSGLDITQYSEDTIKKVFSEKFEHINSFKQTHTTPFDTEQDFLWNVFKKTT